MFQYFSSRGLSTDIKDTHENKPQSNKKLLQVCNKIPQNLLNQIEKKILVFW